MKNLKTLIILCAGYLSGQAFSTEQQDDRLGTDRTRIQALQHPIQQPIHDPLKKLKDLLKERIERMYSGQVEAENVHTYVYLYNVEPNRHSSRVGCFCSACKLGRSGLGIGIITTEGRLSGIEENSTKMIWSGTATFVLEHYEEPRTYRYIRKPHYSFRSAVGKKYLTQKEGGIFEAKEYGKERDSLEDEQGFLVFRKTDKFLRFEEEPVGISLLPDKLSFLEYELGDFRTPPDLRAVTILKNALYRWEIEPSTMTDILTKIGTIGDANNELPKEIIKGYNCTYTANLFLQALGVIPACAQKRSLKNLALHAVSHAGIGLITGIATNHVVGTLAGAITGIIDWWINHEMTSPQQLIDWILDYHKNLTQIPVNQRDAIEPSSHQRIASSFRIIAHNPQPSPQASEEKIAGMFNYRLGTNFEYKTAQEAMNKSIKTTGKSGKFLNSQFE